MAVEYVMIFSVGIIMAIGALSAFDALRQEVASTSAETEKEIIISQIKSKIHHLSSIEDGEAEIQMEIPQSVDGSSYQVSLEEDQILVFVRNTERTHSLNSTVYQGYDFEGTASGGDITLYKSDDTFTIVDR